MSNKLADIMPRNHIPKLNCAVRAGGRDCVSVRAEDRSVIRPVWPIRVPQFISAVRVSIVLSSEVVGPRRQIRPSGLTTRPRRRFPRGHESVLNSLPLRTFHIFTVLSLLPEAKVLPCRAERNAVNMVRMPFEFAQGFVTRKPFAVGP